MYAFKSGFVSIIGRPNVGKSTLLNRLIEQKLSIVTRKPQTTRWVIQGIKTTDQAQIIFIDTPGIQVQPKIALNRFMNKEAINTLSQVDIILFVIEANKWNPLDKNVLHTLQQQVSDKKIIVAINKVDKLAKKQTLLVFIEKLTEETGLLDVLPISASKNVGLDQLEQLIVKSLPAGELYYPEDQLTDRGERFFAAEFIREKLITRLGDELPYRIAITIDAYQEEENIIHIHASIWAEKASQKAIIIGKAGENLKSVGKAARKDLEAFCGKKINLKTWVRIKENWTDSQQALKTLGYSD